MRDPFWIFFFGRIAVCHSLCVSHTLWEALSGGVLSNVFFIKFRETAQHLQTLKMYCMTAGKGMRRDRKTKKTKKPPLLISAKCVSFTARFKLMALILSAPKNPRYNANFQCHWIRLRVWRRRRRRAGKGWGCGCGGREWEEEGGLRLQWMSPYLLSQSSTFNPSPSRGLWDSLAMMPVKWDQ